MNIQNEDKLPRICYILGGEDNPLKAGEKFKTKFGYTCWIDEHGYIHCKETDINVPTLCGLINESEIIREPQFSEDEKALMRLYVGAGYKWFVRDDSGLLTVYENMPGGTNSCGKWAVVPLELLPQLSINHRFNAAEYLEGLK